MELPTGEFDAFIYDCDGTLVDSMSLHFEAWRGAFAQAGARFDFTWPLFLSRAGKSLERTVLELNAQFGESMDALRVVEAQRRLFFERIDQVRPVPEVVAFTARHPAAVQCVASGGDRHVVERELSVIGIRDRFSFVVCSADVERGKPDPDMFELCARRLGVAPERCLVFEDSPLGIEAAKRAGMGWVLVPPPTALAGPTRAKGALVNAVPNSAAREGIPEG